MCAVAAEAAERLASYAGADRDEALEPLIVALARNDVVEGYEAVDPWGEMMWPTRCCVALAALRALGTFDSPRVFDAVARGLLVWKDAELVFAGARTLRELRTYPPVDVELARGLEPLAARCTPEATVTLRAAIIAGWLTRAAPAPESA